MENLVRRTQLYRLLAMLLALALVAVGCGGDDDDDGDSAAEVDDGDGDGDGEAVECTAERAGGTLTMGTGSPFSGMSPYVVLGTGQVGGDYMSAFYDTLMRYDAEEHEFEPNVAKSLEPNSDFSEWTLTLRPDVKFGNGDPLTTADVVAHIEKMKTSRVRAAGMAGEIKTMTVKDAHTMTFDLGTPWGGFPYVLSVEPGWVPNSKLVAERGDGFHLNPAGAGVGAFEMSRLAPNEEIVLSGKDDYWNGQVCLDELRFKNVISPEGSYQAFEQGEFDAVFLGDISVITEAREADTLGYVAELGALGYILADQGITGRADTPYKNVKVREAMQLAVNYDLINERIYDGNGNATSAIVPEESDLYHGMEGPPYDQAKARKLVTDLKASGEWDGKINFLSSNAPNAVELAVLLEGMWEAVGMDVTIEQVAPADASRRLILTREFEVGTNGFAILAPQPWSTLNGLQTGSPRQRTGFSSPAMDAALKKLREATDNKGTIAALKDMQEVWNEEFPVIVFNHGAWAVAVAEDVKGMQFGPDATPYFEKAFIEQ